MHIIIETIQLWFHLINAFSTCTDTLGKYIIFIFYILYLYLVGVEKINFKNRNVRFNKPYVGKCVCKSHGMVILSRPVRCCEVGSVTAGWRRALGRGEGNLGDRMGGKRDSGFSLTGGKGLGMIFWNIRRFIEGNGDIKLQCLTRSRSVLSWCRALGLSLDFPGGPKESWSLSGSALWPGRTERRRDPLCDRDALREGAIRALHHFLP